MFSVTYKFGCYGKPVVFFSKADHLENGKQHQVIRCFLESHFNTSLF